MATARIGISGWRYAPWRGAFYPNGLQQRRELEYAAGKFDSIEINGSFYGPQRPESYLRWYAQTPGDFVFSAKGSREVSHVLRLTGVRGALASFFGSGVLELREKLGPILWQLPPSLAFDADRLTDFFAALPRTIAEARELVAEHDESAIESPGLDERSFAPDGMLEGLEPPSRPNNPDQRLRHALEVRHPSFREPGVVELLREHDVALVVADTAGKWPLLREVTADFIYLRLHGAEQLYVSGYTNEQLDSWAAEVRGWLDGTACPDGRPRDVYLYFDNTAEMHAPYDALALAAKLTRG